MNNEKELKDLLETANKSPIIQQIKDEEAHATLEIRLAAAQKINDFGTKQLDVVPELQKVLIEKELAYTKAKALFESATDQVRQARVTLSTEDNRLNRLINREKDLLLSGYDHRIDDCVLFFQDKLRFLREPGRISNSIHGSQLNIVNMEKNYAVRTNKRAILKALRYCQDGLQLLEQLKLLPQLDAKILDDLKQGVPSIEIFEELNSKTILQSPDTKMDILIEKCTEKLNRALYPYQYQTA